MKHYLDPIIPYHAIDVDDVEDMFRIKEATGIHRFQIIGIMDAVRITGCPGDDAYYAFGEKLRKIKEKMEPKGFEIGWWCLPTFKLGPSPYQKITGIAGKESPISSCPLDEHLQDDYERRISIVASIAHPSSILLEDDYELSNHPNVGFGCFCPLHLNKFKEYAGRYYSREELEELFTAKPLKAVELRRAWAKMSHDSMVEFSKRIRRGIDSADPSISVWLCEPGTTDLDGNLSVEIPRILAGKNTPAIRIFGTQYGSCDTGREIPANLAHAMYEAEHLPADFEIFHESDTYPRNRYFSSAALMESIMTGAMMIGCDSSLFIGIQYLDNHTEDFGYMEMYGRNRDRMRAVQQFAKDSQLDGCQIIYRPDFDFIRCHPVWEGDTAIMGLKHCAKMLGRWGIPYTTRERPVKLLYHAAAENLTDDEILTILKGAVLLDSEAAIELCGRGFAKYIGANVSPAGVLPATEEYILDNAPADFSLGRRINNYAYAPSGSEGAQYAKISLDGAEALTMYRGARDAVVQPGMTRFVNEFGGRIVVMGCSYLNESSNLFNFRKKELMRGVFAWLNGDKPLPAVTLKAPNAWLLFRSNGTEAMLMATNLSADVQENLEIALSEEWRDKNVLLMDANGKWQTAQNTAIQNGILTISGINMGYMKPVLLKLVH